MKSNWRFLFQRLLILALLLPALAVPLGALASAAEPSPATTPPAQAGVPPSLSTRRAEIGPDGRPAVLAYRMKHYVGPDLSIGDGYVDGGRQMKIEKDGHVSSSREIITVDRTRDEQLRKALEYAGTDELKKLDPFDRATRLARHVAKMFTPVEGRRHAEEKTGVLAAKYRNAEVLIGDVPGITGGAGVCRHRSLMYKLLADEAGLKVALVRGYYGREGARQGGHAWNELHLDDGRLLIVDTMNPQPDFHFPDKSSKQAARYFTADHQPMYPQRQPQAPPPPVPALAK